MNLGELDPTSDEYLLDETDGGCLPVSVCFCFMKCHSYVLILCEVMCIVSHISAATYQLTQI